MNVILAYLVPLFAAFRSPIMALLEKGCLMLITWLYATGKIQGDAAGAAAALYAFLSAVISAVTGTQTVAIAQINGGTNGVRVVATEDAKAAGIPAVQEPLK